ncbi:hypothetical protein K2F40_01450 [Clostridium sp. CM028]|uniref:hypothetical protein n=1 Tax=Clostridium sp. CM028 TaxID=2851575 RepID=UPI001C6E8E24|nr:hypothetical protein [Clostridium sp. CM028]MBW9147665.1 hypothetical protein [Clostridium sp. CM028]WLC61993.1 hypothetical protein KTC94_01455 [Clostridium sp. CM028]
MYDAKKEETIKDTSLQYNCIGDRSYYCMCNHSNMLNMKASYVPVEIVLNQFNDISGGISTTSISENSLL